MNPKTALVTEASRRIGRATAIALAKAGTTMPTAHEITPANRL